LIDVRDDIRMHHRQELNPIPDRGSLSLFGAFLFPTIYPSAAPIDLDGIGESVLFDLRVGDTDGASTATRIADL
jgi:hypothetical protein